MTRLGVQTMALYAMWVDGTNVVAQRDGYFLSKEMRGSGALFLSHTAPGEQGEWFQWSIPTPVIAAGKRASVKKVFVLYETGGTAKIRSVHVFDAGQKIQSFDNLSLSGKHSATLDASNSWNVSAHAMKYGLGISVLVDFGPASKSGVPAVKFVSAGADFDA